MALGQPTTPYGLNNIVDFGMSVVWTPTDRYLARSRLRRLAAAHGHDDFASLHRWSVEDLDGFWRAVDQDLGLVWRTPYERVFDSSRGMPWTTTSLRRIIESF